MIVDVIRNTFSADRTSLGIEKEGALTTLVDFLGIVYIIAFLKEVQRVCVCKKLKVENIHRLTGDEQTMNRQLLQFFYIAAMEEIDSTPSHGGTGVLWSQHFLKAL